MYDTLSVTFWGVEFFQSKDNKEVLWGTTIYWPLTRIITEEALEFTGWIVDFLKIFVIIAFILAIPGVTVGSLLPIWVFINSLEIISHMILLKTLMPGNAHYFLKKWNDWRRLFDPSVWEYFEEILSFKSYGLDFSSFH